MLNPNELDRFPLQPVDFVYVSMATTGHTAPTCGSTDSSAVYCPSEDVTVIGLHNFMEGFQYINFTSIQYEIEEDMKYIILSIQACDTAMKVGNRSV